MKLKLHRTKNGTKVSRDGKVVAPVADRLIIKLDRVKDPRFYDKITHHWFVDAILEAHYTITNDRYPIATRR